MFKKRFTIFLDFPIFCGILENSRKSETTGTCLVSPFTSRVISPVAGFIGLRPGGKVTAAFFDAASRKRRTNCSSFCWSMTESWFVSLGIWVCNSILDLLVAR